MGYRLHAHSHARVKGAEAVTPDLGVQTPVEPSSGTETVCPCGCGLVVAWRGGKPGNWAKDGCRQRHWNATHHALELRGLSVLEAERAKRMADEAVKAVREGMKRATVDVLPVKHGRDDRPSCRVRVDIDTWENIEFLRIFLGLPSRSAAVRALVGSATKRAVALAGGEDGQDLA